MRECVGCRALRVRKKTGGEKMPVHMIGDILAAELSHMQAYIRFCSCQLNGAALLQQKTDEHADFKEFLKVTPSRERRQASPLLSQEAEACAGLWEASGVETGMIITFCVCPVASVMSASLQPHGL